MEERLPTLEPVFTSIYELKKALGRGAFSVVYLAVHKERKTQHAVKIIKKESVNLDSNDKSKKRLETEVAILKKVVHPNIIPLHEIIETPNNLYLIMELVLGGELFDKIVSKGNYSERDACLVIKNVLSAIEYLHQNNIAHRDLKPENLLLKAEDDTHVMISDFGLSRVLGDESMAFTACGTPYYVAPEVVSGLGYGREVDLWSIGVITYFLLAGFPPFMGDNLPEIVEQILNADYEFPEPYWNDISPAAKDFVSKLLVVEKGDRLTASQALEHPWIKNPSAATQKPTIQLQQNSKLPKFQQ